MRKYVAKVIQLDKDDKEKLDEKAAQSGMSTNQLIRNIIKDFIKKGK